MLKDKIKGAWKSWTIRINAACGVAVAGLPMLQDSLPAIQPYIHADYFRYAMGAVIAANIALRFKTATSLADKK